MNKDLREIAALYQSPGPDGFRFAEYASTGRVSDWQAFSEDVKREFRAETDIRYKRLLLKLFNYLTHPRS